MRPPWVTEQQIAPANANLEYKSKPVGAGLTSALTLLIAASSFEPAVVVIVYVLGDDMETKNG